jgi:hypothetical protein
MDHDHGASERQRGKPPLRARDPVPQEPARQHHRDHRTDERHRREFAHRQVAQADKGHRRAADQQQSARQVETWVCRAKEAQAQRGPQPHRPPDSRGHRLHGIPHPQGLCHGCKSDGHLGQGVERGKTGHGEHHQAHRPPVAGCRVRVSVPGGSVSQGRCRRLHWMRADSSSHTGVRPEGSSGRVPRSVWDSSGLWKSLPREAARPNSRAVSA